MASPDGAAAIDEQVGVIIRCQDNPSVGVMFCERFRFDEDCVRYAVEAWAPGLTARVNEVVTWGWDSDLRQCALGPVIRMWSAQS